jgi:glycosyltransferase involved in cell wall biosynthesis
MTTRSGAALLGKRVAVLLYSYYPADPRPRRAAEALVREGMDVEVICLRRSKDEPAREMFGGVFIRRIPLARRRGRRLSYLLQYSTFTAAAFGIVSLRALRRRYALVHVHNMPDVLVFAALVPKLLGAKIILDLHDPMPELMVAIFGLAPDSWAVRLLKHVERWSMAFSDVVIAVNLACKRIFTMRGCPAEKIHVVMNAPDEEIFSLRPPSPPDTSRRRFVIMYHGSIVERNGLDVAIAAVAQVRRRLPNVELRIYGEATPFLDVVMEHVRAEGLADAVRYLGGKDLEGIVGGIDDCDVGIIPNRRTLFTEINTPTRIFEYLSRGKPVITGRAPGVCDYFADDELIFFELGDAADLARRIVYVASHPEAVRAIILRGQEVYRAHRWSAECDSFLSRSVALLGTSPPPG